MSTSFLQTSIPVGAESGAGAQRIGSAANQMGNLLNMMNVLVATPEHLVNRTNVGIDRRKKRFGVTTQYGGHNYDYPVHNVKGGGNGQAYPQSKPGYLIGNDGGGQAGYGREIHPHFTPEGDLKDAQMVAFKEADYHSHFVQPEHLHYVDRTKESLQEMFQNQAEDLTRDHIKDLMAKGFSEEEISKQLERERQRKIESAKNHPFSQTALMEATLAKAVPTVLREDFMNTSVAPGDVPLKKNLSAYQAATGQGNPMARKKAMQQKRHEQRMAGEVSKVEAPIRKIPLSETEILQDLIAASKRQHETRAEEAQKQEKQVIDHQILRKTAENAQNNAMMKAMGREIIANPAMGDPQAANKDNRGAYYTMAINA
jgi:hypothetical protein